jgi:hypothetical protein
LLSSFLLLRFDEQIRHEQNRKESEMLYPRLRTERELIYKKLMHTLPLPASSVETLQRHFGKLRDEEQSRVLKDSLGRRGDSEERFGHSMLGRGPEKIMMNPPAKISIESAEKRCSNSAPESSKRAFTNNTPVTQKWQHIIDRDQDDRHFLHHHPLKQRFHNMDFLRRIPGNGVMKQLKSS